MAPLPDGVLVCLTISSLDEEPQAPRSYTTSRTGDVVTVAYDVANWSANMQVDLFCPYKEQRDAIDPVIRGVFSTPPFDGGASFVLTGYHSGRVRAKVTGQSNQDPTGAAGGRWRRIFEVLVSGDVLAAVDYPALTDAELVINAQTTSIVE